MLRRSVRRRIQISFAIAGSWRPTGARLVGLLRSMITSFVALGVTLFILPGEQSSGLLIVGLLAQAVIIWFVIEAAGCGSVPSVPATGSVAYFTTAPW